MQREVHQLPLHSPYGYLEASLPTECAVGVSTPDRGRCPSSWLLAPGSPGNSTITALMEYMVLDLMASIQAVCEVMAHLS